MKLSTHEDIAAPIAHVFAQASDFESFERRVMRAGATVARRQSGPIGVGSVWDVNAMFRGRMRHFICTLTACDAPDSYVVTTETDGLVFVTQLTLVALSPKQTRACVVIEISARKLSARLVLQSLKLVRTRLSDQLRSRIRGHAQGIAEAYRQAG
ncbi:MULTISPECIES: SRPBCC family protein [unclassified Yoonia]|uniref:SRPBCC family protein n=1 Tax=unclassified Yoonia TaxID=2629118 RepID=UPI002B002C3C|nr:MULTISPECIES: SRPBCC family protein [unclassified Yoonia]